MNYEGMANDSNPIYNAGFIEGRKFEQVLAEEAAAKQAKAETHNNIGKVGGITVSLRVTEMEVFKELAAISHQMAKACQVATHIPECKEALDKFMEFSLNQDLKELERQEKQQAK